LNFTGGPATVTVAIAWPLGRKGFVPQLSLVYSPGNENGLNGLGCNITIAIFLSGNAGEGGG